MAICAILLSTGCSIILIILFWMDEWWCWWFQRGSNFLLTICYSLYSWILDLSSFSRERWWIYFPSNFFLSFILSNSRIEYQIKSIFFLSRQDIMGTNKNKTHNHHHSAEKMKRHTIEKKGISIHFSHHNKNWFTVIFFIFHHHQLLLLASYSNWASPFWIAIHQQITAHSAIASQLYSVPVSQVK